MIVFIDTEVSPQTKKVADYGAVREDGAVMHTHSKGNTDSSVHFSDSNKIRYNNENIQRDLRQRNVYCS